jgi:hypothetical protein
MVETGDRVEILVEDGKPSQVLVGGVVVPHAAFSVSAGEGMATHVTIQFGKPVDVRVSGYLLADEDAAGYVAWKKNGSKSI